MNTKNKKYIIDGYKGVMELDLTNIDPKYHKLYIDQHYQDIKDYNIYQSTLETHLQYENTIVRIQKNNEVERDIIIKKIEKKKKEKDQYYERINESKKKYEKNINEKYK